MPEQTLKQKSTIGILWGFVEKLSVYGIQFVISVIIARILMPSDYGLIGMLTIFMALSNLFVDSGFSQALIQKRDRSNIDFSTVFYFNLAISIVVYFLLFVSAPYIAEFYKTPQLSMITRVISLNVILQSLSIVQVTKLTIDLNFKIKAIVNTISGLLSGLLGVALAYLGYGVWALVFQTLAKTFINSVLFGILIKWMPLMAFSVQSFKILFHFGSKLLIAGTVATLVNNFYTILIGKQFSAKELGYYTRGKQFSDLFANTVTDVLQSVTFPIMSSLQDRDEKLYDVYRKLIRFTMFLVLPSMVSLALISEPFIRLLLTEKWMSAVPILQWLSIARIFTPISSLNLNILKAKGRSDLFLKIDLSKLPLTVGALLITYRFGIFYVVVGQTVVTLICFFINAYYPGKLLKYGALKQLNDIKPMIIAVLGMAGVMYSVVQLIPYDILKISISLIMGFSTYYGICYIQGINEIKEVKLLFEKVKTKFVKE